MSNGNRTRKTTCDICLCLRIFFCSEVNILKSGNTIPNTIYFCILFCDCGSGKCCRFSKIQAFLDARYVFFFFFFFFFLAVTGHVLVHCRRA